MMEKEMLERMRTLREEEFERRSDEGRRRIGRRWEGWLRRVKSW